MLFVVVVVWGGGLLLSLSHIASPNPECIPRPHRRAKPFFYQFESTTARQTFLKPGKTTTWNKHKKS